MKMLVPLVMIIGCVVHRFEFRKNLNKSIEYSDAQHLQINRSAARVAIL